LSAFGAALLVGVGALAAEASLNAAIAAVINGALGFALV
jgi:hypothetical protein